MSRLSFLALLLFLPLVETIGDPEQHTVPETKLGWVPAHIPQKSSNGFVFSQKQS